MVDVYRLPLVLCPNLGFILPVHMNALTDLVIGPAATLFRVAGSTFQICSLFTALIYASFIVLSVTVIAFANTRVSTWGLSQVAVPSHCSYTRLQHDLSQVSTLTP